MDADVKANGKGFPELIRENNPAPPIINSKRNTPSPEPSSSDKGERSMRMAKSLSENYTAFLSELYSVPSGPSSPSLESSHENPPSTILIPTSPSLNHIGYIESPTSIIASYQQDRVALPPTTNPISDILNLTSAGIEVLEDDDESIVILPSEHPLSESHSNENREKEHELNFEESPKLPLKQEPQTRSVESIIIQPHTGLLIKAQTPSIGKLKVDELELDVTRKHDSIEYINNTLQNLSRPSSSKNISFRGSSKSIVAPITTALRSAIGTNSGSENSIAFNPNSPQLRSLPIFSQDDVQKAQSIDMVVHRSLSRKTIPDASLHRSVSRMNYESKLPNESITGLSSIPISNLSTTANNRSGSIQVPPIPPDPPKVNDNLARSQSAVSSMVRNFGGRRNSAPMNFFSASGPSINFKNGSVKPLITFPDGTEVDVPSSMINKLMGSMNGELTDKRHWIIQLIIGGVKRALRIGKEFNNGTIEAYYTYYYGAYRKQWQLLDLFAFIISLLFWLYALIFNEIDTAGSRYMIILIIMILVPATELAFSFTKRHRRYALRAHLVMLFMFGIALCGLELLGLV